MANKRMFTRELLESDKFLELSHNAKVFLTLPPIMKAL